MSRPALILALVSALCLGTAFGFMGGVVFSKVWIERHEDSDRGRRKPRREGAFGERGVPSARHMMPRLQRMLDLSPSQAEAIRVEIDSTRGEFAKVRDSLHARIGRHLTPDQRERWNRAMRERHPGEPRGLDPRTFRAEPGREGETSR